MSQKSTIASQEVHTRSQKLLSPLIWDLCDTLVNISAKDKNQSFSKELQKDLVVVILEGAKIKSAFTKGKERMAIQDWEAKFKILADCLMTFDELAYSFDWEFLEPKLKSVKETTQSLLKSYSKLNAALEGANKFFDYILDQKLWEKLYNDKQWIACSKELARILAQMTKDKMI